MSILDMVKRISLLAMLVILPSMMLRAASESYIQTLTGKLKQGDSCTVIDDKFLHLPLIDWNRINHLSVDNIVSFELRFDTAVMYHTRSFTCKLNVSIKYYTSRDQQEPDEINNIDLIVRYDTAKGSAFPTNAFYKFKNAFKVVVVVNSITSAEWGEHIPAAFRIKNQILVERKYPYAPTIKGGLSLSKGEGSEAESGGGMVAQRASVGNTDKQLTISWDETDFEFGEEYDVEWTYIDGASTVAEQIALSYTPGGVIKIPDATVAGWMRNNATRVTVPGLRYTINIPYRDGYVIFRVRSVYHREETGVREHSPWVYRDDVGDKTLAVKIEAVDALEEGITWQYTAAFAEEGKRKEVVTYFDGALRSRQSVTLSNSDQTMKANDPLQRQETAIVQETFYDVMGRQSMNLLPAPVKSKSIGYYRGFNRNNSDQPLSNTDINLYTNTEWASCAISGSLLTSTPGATYQYAGASQYYSPNNSFLGDDNFYFTKFVPDAEKRPYSLTQYTADNTGRIRAQGGPGATLLVEKGHGTQYFYGKAGQRELDRLFGSEVGSETHYMKNMVVDPNGQVSVSYINSNGKTIATALAGDPSKYTAVLPSAADPGAKVTMNQRLVSPEGFRRDPAGMIMHSSSKFTAAKKGWYQISYNVSPASLTTTFPGGQFCSNCAYKLVIQVVDDCGNAGGYAESAVFTGNDVTCNPSAQPFTGSVDVEAKKIGEYTVNISLKLSEDVVKAQEDYYIQNNGNLKKIEDFFNTALANLDLASCYNTCEECKTLGDNAQQFKEKVTKVLGEELFATFTNHSAIDNWITTIYNQLKATCNALDCRATAACEDYLQQMKSDVRPGGQYALYAYNETTEQYSLTEPAINVLSFYTQHDFYYTQENGETGNARNLPTVSDFIKLYLTHPDWADVLVEHHIEYCSYLWCKDAGNGGKNEISYNYDKTLREKSSADIWSMTPLIDEDPFFNNGGRGVGVKAQMQYDLDNLSTTIGMKVKDANGSPLIPKSIQALVDWMLYCKPASASPTNTDIVNSWMAGCNPSAACRSVTAEWELYRNYYLQVKSKYMRYVKEQAQPTCKNCFIGQDVLSAQSCTISDGACPTGGFTQQYTELPNIQGEGYYVWNRTLIKFVSNTGPVSRPIKFIFREVYTDDYETREYNHEVIMQAGQSEVEVGETFISWTDLIWNGYQDLGEVTTHAFYFIETQCVPPIPTPKSTCTDDPGYAAYQNKSRVFNEYVAVDMYAACGVTNTPAPTEVQKLNALRVEALTQLEALKINWNDQLKAVRDEYPLLFGSVSNTTIEQLVEALEDIAAKNIEIGNSYATIRPASILPAGVTVNGLNSFQQAFNAYIPAGLMLQGFSPYLLDKPYPYNKTPIESNPNAHALSADICTNLTAMKARYTTSGYPGTFHTWLQLQLGEDYMLTASQLNELETRCASSCRYLSKPMLLPVALTTPTLSNTDHPFVDCNRINTLITELNNLVSGVPATGKLYRKLLVNYLNHKLGYALSYSEYARFKNECTGNATAVLYNKAASPVLVPNDFHCVADNIRAAYEIAGQEYDRYILIERKKFRNAYIAKCIGNSAFADVSGEVYEYHYTLYYYDQSGNLVKTIPPEGVRFLGEEELEKLRQLREGGSAVCDGQGVPQTEEKLAAFNAFSDRLQDGTLKAVEMWLYNGGSAASRKVRFVSPDNRYFYQAAIHNNTLWVELYSLQPDGNGGVTITQSAQVAAGLGSVTLQAWSHLVVQSASFLAGAWDLYLDGTKLTLLPTPPPYPFEWSIGGGLVMPTEQLSDLKHMRYYNRMTTAQEINNNFKNACLSPVSALAVSNAPLLFWGRFNIPAPGSETTIGGNSTVEVVNHFIVPQHGLATYYAYNSLNKVVKQSSPDGGSKGIFYDRLGRVVISQNDEQFISSVDDVSNRYSYIVYDAHGRISEAGEKINSNRAVTEESARTESFLSEFYSAGENRHVVKTVYDESPLETPGILTNLRTRVVATVLRELGNGPINQATYYCYDISGNVKTLYQYSLPLVTVDATTGVKRFDYEYDLVSGIPRLIKYQEGKGDQFFYRYQYDADNRVVGVYTSRDKLIWNTEAAYRYYLHGPLARKELGNDNGSTGKVQGIDYAYTIQGWLKGINSQQLDINADMSKDGNSNGNFGSYARDAFAVSLGYFGGDFSAISGGSSFSMSYSHPTVLPNSASGNALFNSNISNATLALSRIDNGAAKGYSYAYDQLNRLTQMRMHSIGAGGTSWGSSSVIDAYKENVTYDGNGNILTYERNGNKVGKLPMDHMTYHYNKVNGLLVNNKLNYVADAVNKDDYEDDIDNQVVNNYEYDKLGNLIKDRAENLQSVKWTVSGKIAMVKRGLTGGPTTTIIYRYDGSDNRVAKEVTVKQVSGAETTNITYYVRDAKGNVMGVYRRSSDSKLWWQEQHLYGSGRLGIWKPGLEVTPTWQAPGQSGGTIVLGQRYYELTNHLGNVLAVITDKKLPSSGGGFEAEVISTTDYYPFGMAMPGRSTQGPDCKDVYEKDMTEMRVSSDLNANVTASGANKYIQNGITWQQQANALITYASGAIRVQNSGTSGSDGVLAIIPASMVKPNTTYIMECDIVDKSPEIIEFGINAQSNTGDGYRTSVLASGTGHHSIIFTTGETVGNWVALRISGRPTLTAGLYFVVDNLTLKEYLVVDKPLVHETGFSGAIMSGSNVNDGGQVWQPNAGTTSVGITGTTDKKLVVNCTSAADARVMTVLPIEGGQRYLVKFSLGSNPADKRVFIDIRMRSGTNWVYYQSGIFLLGSGNYQYDFIAPAGSNDLRFDFTRYSTGNSWDGIDIPYTIDNFSLNKIVPIPTQTTLVCDPGADPTKENGLYRYGFNGKENDNEVKGDGNQQDYGMRIYDPRLGKFLSVDPLTEEYPFYTPYQFAGNSPILAVDIDGMEGDKNVNATEKAEPTEFVNYWDNDEDNKKFKKSALFDEYKKILKPGEIINRINGVYVFSRESDVDNSTKYYWYNGKEWTEFTPTVYHYPVDRNPLKTIFWDVPIKPFLPIENVDFYGSLQVKKTSRPSLGMYPADVKIPADNLTLVTVVAGGQIGYSSEKDKFIGEFVTVDRSYLNYKIEALRTDVRIIPFNNAINLPFGATENQAPLGDFVSSGRVLTTLMKVRGVDIQSDFVYRIGEKPQIGLRAKYETAKVAGYSLEVGVGFRGTPKWPSIFSILREAIK